MIRLRKEAEKDIRDAYDWYESQRQFLGKAFLSEIDSILERIQENPQLYAHAYKSIRRALCKRFPYAVYYMDNDSNIVVIAVLQQRRKPTVWKKRK